MKHIWQLIKETLAEAREDNLSIFAAGFSYYLLFSLIPLLIVVIVVAGKIIGMGTIGNTLSGQLSVMFDAEVASSFKVFLGSATNVTLSRVGLVGFFIVLFGATKIFSVLQQAMSKIWDKEAKRKGGLRGAMTRRLHSAVLMLIPILLVLVWFLMDTLGSIFRQRFGLYLYGIGFRYVFPTLAYIFSLGLFAVVFALINRYLPNRKPSWKDVWVGAAVTTTLFALGKLIFSTFFHFGRVSSLFGAAGSIILVLMWIYFSMLVVLYGSEFTRIYTRKHGSWKTPHV